MDWTLQLRFPVLRDYSVFRIVDLGAGNTGLQDASGMLVGAYIFDIVTIDHQTLPDTVRGASVPQILYAAAGRPAPPGLCARNACRRACLRGHPFDATNTYVDPSIQQVRRHHLSVG